MPATKFVHGTAYPIDTLPDDLYDKTIPNRDRWAIKNAMFWNDCQGWWIGHVSEERQACDFGRSIARFWSPLPPDPMTREQILTERGMDVCPNCDVARDIGRPHTCGQHSLELVTEQRRLQAIADAKS